MKGLIIYYSRTGKTRFLAEKLSEIMGIDIAEVRDLRKRGGPFGFLRGARDARLGLKTQVAPKSFDLDRYELILLGTPVWADSPTPAISTFLHTHNLKGKKVIIFVTSRGVGYRQAIDILRGKVEARGGMVVAVGSVNTWLRGRNYLAKAASLLAKSWQYVTADLG